MSKPKIYQCPEPDCRVFIKGRGKADAHARIHKVTRPPAKKVLAPKRARVYSEDVG